jgi:hypothetical protein
VISPKQAAKMSDGKVSYIDSVVASRAAHQIALKPGASEEQINDVRNLVSDINRGMAMQGVQVTFAEFLRDIFR